RERGRLVGIVGHRHYSSHAFSDIDTTWGPSHPFYPPALRRRFPPATLARRRTERCTEGWMANQTRTVSPPRTPWTPPPWKLAPPDSAATNDATRMTCKGRWTPATKPSVSTLAIPTPITTAAASRVRWAKRPQRFRTSTAPSS